LINQPYLSKVCVASVCALLFIWVLPESIALRHLLLGIGFISSLGLIQKNWACFDKCRATMIPLYLIFALFVWVGIHYAFFSLNRGLELHEISSLWIRTFAGVVTAIGLAISLSQFPGLRKYFFFSLFFVPLINVAAYLYDCYLHGGLVEPNAFPFFLYAKVETAYFGGLAAAFAAAQIIYLSGKNQARQHALIVGLDLLGIVLVLISALVSSTKNGMAIAMAVCVVLVLAICVFAVRAVRTSKLFNIGIALFILVMAVMVWQGHQAKASKGWGTVFQDAKLGLDIDTYKQWQKFEGSVPFPVNSLGVPAAGNTYSRFAYAAVGVRLISQYPLGYGSINRSFDGLQTLAEIPHEHHGQVHSGWIDLGLAFGVPAVLLLMGCLISTMYFCLVWRSALGSIAAAFSFMLLGFCLISEMSYKQYFESWIFIMAFCAAVVALAPLTKAPLSTVR
jgi:O-Antigen ligase